MDKYLLRTIRGTRRSRTANVAGELLEIVIGRVHASAGAAILRGGCARGLLWLLVLRMMKLMVLNRLHGVDMARDAGGDIVQAARRIWIVVVQTVLGGGVVRGRRMGVRRGIHVHIFSLARGGVDVRVGVYMWFSRVW